MLRACVVGMGVIGYRHAKLYQADPLSELVGVCDWNPQRAAEASARFGVPAFCDVRDMLQTLRPDVCSIATGGHEYAASTICPPCKPSNTAAAYWAKSPSPTRSTKPRRWSPGRSEKGVLLRHQPQSPLHARRPACQTLAGRRPHRTPALHQHEHVDQESARNLALFPAQGAAPAHGRHHALLLRRHRGRAVLRHQSAGPRHLVDRHLQHALQEWRGGHADRQLRHRARPSHGTLRSRRHSRVAS